jgi:hypothetical protein
MGGGNEVVTPQVPLQLVDSCPARASRPIFSSSYDGFGLGGACVQRATGQNWSTSLKIMGALGWGLWSYDDLVYRYRQLGYGWIPHNAGFGFLDLAPSILHSDWFWDYIS